MAELFREVEDEDDFVGLRFGLPFGRFQHSKSLAVGMEIEIPISISAIGERFPS